MRFAAPNKTKQSENSRLTAKEDGRCFKNEGYTMILSKRRDDKIDVVIFTLSQQYGSALLSKVGYKSLNIG